jgi:uncharacterized protein (DUF433 family)
MSELNNHQSAVVRNERGLSIAGTRITLYHLMDYLKVGWSPQLIRQWLDLTEKQLADAMDYINIHRNEVENEYQLVLQQAKESRNYWEAYNKERFERIAASRSEADPVWVKIRDRKAELGMK